MVGGGRVVRILNPNRKRDFLGLMAPQAQAVKDALASYDENENVIDEAAIRALLPPGKRNVPEGHLMQWLLDEGYEVE